MKLDKLIIAKINRHNFDERDRERTLRRAVQRIERLGYKVSLQVAGALDGYFPRNDSPPQAYTFAAM